MKFREVIKCFFQDFAVGIFITKSLGMSQMPSMKDHDVRFREYGNS